MQRRVLAFLIAAVATLGVAAFTLSFDALRGLAVAAGVNERLAWLWPVIVDGFICVATVAAVLLRPRGWRIAWYPWATLAAAAFVSVSGNALHARSHADLTAVSLTVAGLVSAVPAVVVLLSSHMLVVLLAPPARVPADVPRPDSLGPLLDSTANAPTNGNVRVPKPAMDELRAWVSAESASGRTVTGSMVAHRYGVSAATGRRWLQAMRDPGPGVINPTEPSSSREVVPDLAWREVSQNGTSRAAAPP